MKTSLAPMYPSTPRMEDPTPPAKRPRIPTIRPEGITWRTEAAFLHLQLDFANDSDEPIAEHEIHVDAAPFGAFIPFVPVTKRILAGFDAGERRRETIVVPLRDLEPAKSPTRVEALDFSDPVPVPLRGHGVEFLVKEKTLGHLVEAVATADASWSGNVQVRFENAPDENVEVHRSGFEVEPGRVHRVGFVNWENEMYYIDARSGASGWTAKIHGYGQFGTLEISAPDGPGLCATVDAIVTRRSDGKVVPVHFALKATG